MLVEGLAVQQHALHPEGELAAQPALLRVVQPLAEGGEHREHLLRVLAVLEPEQGMDHACFRGHSDSFSRADTLSCPTHRHEP
ncbi:MAG: hypothetical protein ACLFRW_04530 [Halorhodospira sp.]